MESNLHQTQFSPQTGGYTVMIPVFEGPLDLLLQLIEHAELDITAISLGQVTDQYLAYIRSMQVPADEISAFLVLAAKLLQMKFCCPGLR
jgi:segregation and condensation protein A